jgi:hypothetical protein
MGDLRVGRCKNALSQQRLGLRPKVFAGTEEGVPLVTNGGQIGATSPSSDFATIAPPASKGEQTDYDGAVLKCHAGHAA